MDMTTRKLPGLFHVLCLVGDKSCTLRHSRSAYNCGAPTLPTIARTLLASTTPGSGVSAVFEHTFPLSKRYQKLTKKDQLFGCHKLETCPSIFGCTACCFAGRMAGRSGPTGALEP